MLPRVIAIDDDEMFLTAIKTLFSEKQIPLATFADPEKALQAIEQAKADGTPYRMAIVDFEMPIKGDEVVREIKKIDPRTHTRSFCRPMSLTKKRLYVLPQELTTSITSGRARRLSCLLQRWLR